jgi:tetratricopeptide (TPR) repeat protein
MTQDTSSTKFYTTHILLLLSIMLAFGAMVYSNTFDSPLIFDDEFFIVNDHAIRMTELSWNSIKTAALEGKPAHRYLPNISLAINYYFGRLNPFGYHLVNLILHLLSGVCLFFFLRLTLRASIKKPKALIIISTQCNRRGGVYPRPQREGIKPSPTMDAMITEAFDYKTNPDIIAFFASLLWIVQPVGTQAVTYICQRMASMVALFYILSLLLYVKGRMAMQQTPSDRLRQGEVGQQGQLMKAVTAYQAALILTDDNEEILSRALLSRLAKTYFLLQRFGVTVAFYLKLIDLNPDNAHLYYNTAPVHAVQGNFLQANVFKKKPIVLKIFNGVTI